MYHLYRNIHFSLVLKSLYKDIRTLDYQYKKIKLNWDYGFYFFFCEFTVKILTEDRR